MLEKGHVYLNMTSKKTLILHKGLYIPNVSRNLISGSLLVSRGYKIILKSSKFVIICNNEFIRKDFISKGLFKLIIIPKDSNKTHSVVLNLESFNIWHVGLVILILIRSNM